jgi:hypothetical protein
MCFKCFVLIDDMVTFNCWDDNDGDDDDDDDDDDSNRLRFL